MSPKKSKGKLRMADKAAAAPAVSRPAYGPRRVAITGMGTVNALGRNVPNTLAAMRDGRCGINQQRRYASARGSIQL